MHTVGSEKSTHCRRRCQFHSVVAYTWSPQWKGFRGVINWSTQTWKSWGLYLWSRIHLWTTSGYGKAIQRRRRRRCSRGYGICTLGRGVCYRTRQSLLVKLQYQSLNSQFSMQKEWLHLELQPDSNPRFQVHSTVCESVELWWALNSGIQVKCREACNDKTTIYDTIFYLTCFEHRFDLLFLEPPELFRLPCWTFRGLKPFQNSEPTDFLKKKNMSRTCKKKNVLKLPYFLAAMFQQGWKSNKYVDIWYISIYTVFFCKTNCKSCINFKMYGDLHPSFITRFLALRLPQLLHVPRTSRTSADTND